MTARTAKAYNIIITAGGTSEKIDNVRKITNSGSGKLGTAIANEILKNFDRELKTLYFICSKNSIKPEGEKIRIIEIDDTKNLKNEVESLLKNEKIDYFIHSMAVSDFTVDHITTASLLAKNIQDSSDSDLTEVIKNNKNTLTGTKISSREGNLLIMLKPTPKIISLIKTLSPKTFLIGFKLLDGVPEEELKSVAKKLLEKNSCDLVVANDLSNIRKGNHKAFIIDTENNTYEANGKEDIAKKLIKRMLEK